jgi:hypothetical protein
MMPLPPTGDPTMAMALPTPTPDAPVTGDAAESIALPMTTEQMGIWWARVERARARRDVVTEEWQKNINAYEGKPLATAPTSDWVNPNTDFADVEQKKAQLFFTTPEIHCIPQEPASTGQEATILIKQAVLNDKLGPNGVDAKRVMDKTIFDVLCPAGWGATKIGYDVTTRPVTQSIPHPIPGMPPIEQTIDVPVYEEWFWEHFSPKKLLVPDDYHDNVFDKAPWLGMEFSLPLIAAKRQFKLPDDFTSTSGEDPYIFEDAQGSGSSKVRPQSRDLVTGVEIWYRAADEDETVFHPELFRKLVLIDGLSDRPATHRDSPYQSLDAQGRLTADSMVGNPIHVLTIRDVTDSAYIRSDCSMTRDLVDQLSKFLTTQTKQRDTAIPMRLVDEGVITPDVMQKITNGDYGSFIPIPEGRLEPPPIVEIARAQYPRENFEGQARIERQLAKTLALDSNQSGATDATNRTATELTIVQNNASVRLKGERNRVIQFFLAGVRKFDSLLQRFATDTSVVQIVGPDGAKEFKAWNRLTIAGRWAYDIKPDSGNDLDEATARKQALDTYNFLGKDPLVDRSYLIGELAPALHLDPQRLKAQPKPPQPDRPTLGFSFKGEDLLNPLCVAVMIQGGVSITPDMISQAHTLIQTATGIPAPPIAPAPGIPGMPPTTPTPQNPGPPHPPPPAPPQPGHPGAMPRGDLVSEHAAQHTGAIPGAPSLPQRIVPL